MSHRLRCRHCNGSGAVPLPATLRRTLRAMPRAGSITAEELLLRLGERVGTTAISNRLEALRRMRLVTRQRAGKWWLYARKC